MTNAMFGRLLAVAMAGAVLAGCERAEAPPAPVAKAPTPAPAAVVTAPSALTRAEILAALNSAAANPMGGLAEQTGLTGRTFVLRLPFGCAGPREAGAVGIEGLASATWAKDRASLRLSVTPADWARSPVVLAPGSEPAWDGVNGFWIARPWLASDRCPAAPEAPADPEVETSAAPRPAASPMTAGLAAILTSEGSRLGRRDTRDAYSFVVRGSDGRPPEPATSGYRLVLEGRIGSFPDGAAIRCLSESPDRRPVCVTAVQLDVIAFEDAEGVRLSEWRPT